MVNAKKRILVLTLILAAALLIYIGRSVVVKDEEEKITLNEETIILDVRTPEEFRQGHIENAILIPDYNIKDLIEYVILDKNQKIAVYCQTGVRSKKAVEELIDMGYKNAYDFGSITNCKEELVGEENIDGSWESINSALFRSKTIVKFPLLALIKAEDIYLYGINDRDRYTGMILYQDGQGTYFDWPRLTPRCIFPELSCFDYDNDGEKEVAVTLYVGSGTGVAIMDLHILKIDKSENSNKIQYTDHSLLGMHAQGWFNKGVNGKMSKDGKNIILDFNDKTYTVKTKYYESLALSDKVIKIDYGDIVYFEIEGTVIKTKIALGCRYESFATPAFFGDITATVKFDGERFSLTDYEFSPSDE